MDGIGKARRAGLKNRRYDQTSDKNIGKSRSLTAVPDQERRGRVRGDRAW